MSAEKQKAPAKPNTPPAPKPEVTRDNLTAENLSYFTPHSPEDEEAAHLIENAPFKLVDKRARYHKVAALPFHGPFPEPSPSPKSFDDFMPSANPTRDELKMMYRHELHDQIKPLIPADAEYELGEGHEGLKKKELNEFITHHIESLNKDITESDLRQLSPDTIIEHYAALRKAGVDNQVLIQSLDLDRPVKEVQQLHDELIASGVDPRDLELIRQGIAFVTPASEKTSRVAAAHKSPESIVNKAGSSSSTHAEEIVESAKKNSKKLDTPNKRRIAKKAAEKAPEAPQSFARQFGEEIVRRVMEDK